MTKFEKTQKLLSAMSKIELYSRQMERYCHVEEATYEEYQKYKEVVEENKEIIFNLAMAD